jgi:hypothetical protein
LLFVARGARAQDGIIQALNLDKLQITSLGVFAGRINPSQLEPTNFVAIQADYGEVVPNWRVVFNASYWVSRFQDAVVKEFADSLQKSESDPNAHVVPSRINLYDVTFGADVRYAPTYSGEIKPFLGFGVAAHVINADGALIRGTFVERALDDIATGIYATTGVSFKLLGHLGVEGAVRADLLSGFRSTQVRAGASYYFGQIRGLKSGTGVDSGETK